MKTALSYITARAPQQEPRDLPSEVEVLYLISLLAQQSSLYSFKAYVPTREPSNSLDLYYFLLDNPKTIAIKHRRSVYFICHQSFVPQSCKHNITSMNISVVAEALSKDLQALNQVRKDLERLPKFILDDIAYRAD